MALEYWGHPEHCEPEDRVIAALPAADRRR